MSFGHRLGVEHTRFLVFLVVAADLAIASCEEGFTIAKEPDPGRVPHLRSHQKSQLRILSRICDTAA